MTTYYICRFANLKELELVQASDEQLASKIAGAAWACEETDVDTVAIRADSENGTYAYLKGAALLSMELTASNIQIWQEEGKRIYDYLHGAQEGGRIWEAFGTFFCEIDSYEGFCDQSKGFEGLGAGLVNAVCDYINDNIREERNEFAKILKRMYEIQQLNVVSS